MPHDFVGTVAAQVRSALEEDSADRLEAIGFLAHLRDDPRVRPYLEYLMYDYDVEVSALACLALGGWLMSLRQPD